MAYTGAEHYDAPRFGVRFGSDSFAGMCVKSLMLVNGATALSVLLFLAIILQKATIAAGPLSLGIFSYLAGIGAALLCVFCLWLLETETSRKREFSPSKMGAIAFALLGVASFMHGSWKVAAAFKTLEPLTVTSIALPPQPAPVALVQPAPAAPVIQPPAPALASLQPYAVAQIPPVPIPKCLPVVPATRPQPVPFQGYAKWAYHIEVRDERTGRISSN